MDVSSFSIPPRVHYWNEIIQQVHYCFRFFVHIDKNPMKPPGIDELASGTGIRFWSGLSVRDRLRVVAVMGEILLGLWLESLLVGLTVLPCTSRNLYLSRYSRGRMVGADEDVRYLRLLENPMKHWPPQKKKKAWIDWQWKGHPLFWALCNVYLSIVFHTFRSLLFTEQQMSVILFQCLTNW